jgi:hypothetical protein
MMMIVWDFLAGFFGTLGMVATGLAYGLAKLLLWGVPIILGIYLLHRLDRAAGRRWPKLTLTYKLQKEQEERDALHEEMERKRREEWKRLRKSQGTIQGTKDP